MPKIAQKVVFARKPKIARIFSKIWSGKPVNTQNYQKNPKLLDIIRKSKIAQKLEITQELRIVGKSEIIQNYWKIDRKSVNYPKAWKSENSRSTRKCENYRVKVRYADSRAALLSWKEWLWNNHEMSSAAGERVI